MNMSTVVEVKESVTRAVMLEFGMPMFPAHHADGDGCFFCAVSEGDRLFYAAHRILKTDDGNYDTGGEYYQDLLRNMPGVTPSEFYTVLKEIATLV